MEEFELDLAMWGLGALLRGWSEEEIEKAKDNTRRHRRAKPFPREAFQSLRRNNGLMKWGAL